MRRITEHHIIYLFIYEISWQLKPIWRSECSIMTHIRKAYAERQHTHTGETQTYQNNSVCGCALSQHIYIYICICIYILLTGWWMKCTVRSPRKRDRRIDRTRTKRRKYSCSKRRVYFLYSAAAAAGCLTLSDTKEYIYIYILLNPPLQ